MDTSIQNFVNLYESLPQSCKQSVEDRIEGMIFVLNSENGLTNSANSDKQEKSVERTDEHER